VSDDETAGARFRIGDIHPVPDDETLAAITAALDAGWPEPTIVDTAAPLANLRWRFGLRRWNERPLPRRTWGV